MHFDMLDTMPARGTRGAYRKEDRVQLPPELQKELVEKAAAKFGNCQELAKHLNIPKSSVHYYRIGRLTMPVSVLNDILKLAKDDGLREKIESRGITKDRSWATEYAQDVFREMCREKVRLPAREELEGDDDLRRKAAAIVSYVLAEGSVWLQKTRFAEHAVNITFADHEADLYDHFRRLCREVFCYDIGSPQLPGNGARAIRGFIYSRFVAEWLVENGVRIGDKSSQSIRLPIWVRDTNDYGTIISALQPWCDGEGHVHASRSTANRQFSISQSRHSDVDVTMLDHRLATPIGRSLSAGKISKMSLFDIAALDYLQALSRSTVLDDVTAMFRRAGFKPKLGISQLRHKDDGFWSCIWMLKFDSRDTLRLSHEGFVTQKRKKAILDGN